MDVLKRTSPNRDTRVGRGLARFTRFLFAFAAIALSGATGAFAATGEPAAGEVVVDDRVHEARAERPADHHGRRRARRKRVR